MYLFIYLFFCSNAQFNHDNYPQRIKTQFLPRTNLRTIWHLVKKTWKSPDSKEKQNHGRRALIKQFKHPIGEYVFFNKQGCIRTIPIGTLKLVYERKRNGDVVFITAYPLFWRPDVRTIFPSKTNFVAVISMIIIMWTVLLLVVTMKTLHVLYFCCLCLPKLAFLLLSCFAAVGSIIGCFHEFWYHLYYYYYRSCYRTTKNIYINVTLKPNDIYFDRQRFSRASSMLRCLVSADSEETKAWKLGCIYYLLSYMSCSKGFLPVVILIPNNT